MKASIKTYFATGLLVLLPLVITIWIAQSIVQWLDSAFPSHALLGKDIPGVGLLISLVVIFLAGVLGRNIFGNWLMEQFSRLMGQVPFIGSVYGSLRQVMLTLANTHGDRFGKAVLVEFPRAGSWSVGFITNDKPPKEVTTMINDSLVSVFVPTTPNPTSGFFMFVPKESVKPLNVSVDDAFKIIVSLGIILPSGEVRPVTKGEIK